MPRILSLRCLGLLGLVLMAASCTRPGPPQVVVYTALDGEFSEPILRAYAAQGVDVRWTLDVESTKTVGLANRLIAERARPRCDVFWNNEILHTLRLERLGLLEAYISPVGAEYPAAYRAADGSWYGFAARARVLVVNRERVPEAERPQSILDLVDPRWKGRVGIAKPLFGTTATHAAVLYATWGPERANDFFRRLHDNVVVLSGNKQVALAVGRGELLWGLTDTDDAIIEQDRGLPVEIVFPDQQQGGWGTLFIPNTLCILKGAPHLAEARRLVEHLLQPAIEAQLALGPSAQFPVHPAARERSRVQGDATVRWMAADFGKAAASWDEVARDLREIFAAAD